MKVSCYHVRFAVVVWVPSPLIHPRGLPCQQPLSFRQKTAQVLPWSGRFAVGRNAVSGVVKARVLGLFRHNNRKNPYLFWDTLRKLVTTERLEYKKLTA